MTLARPGLTFPGPSFGLPCCRVAVCVPVFDRLIELAMHVLALAAARAGMNTPFAQQRRTCGGVAWLGHRLSPVLDGYLKTQNWVESFRHGLHEPGATVKRISVGATSSVHPNDSACRDSS